MFVTIDADGIQLAQQDSPSIAVPRLGVGGMRVREGFHPQIAKSTDKSAEENLTLVHSLSLFPSILSPNITID